MKQREE